MKMWKEKKEFVLVDAESSQARMLVMSRSLSAFTRKGANGLNEMIALYIRGG